MKKIVFLLAMMVGFITLTNAQTFTPRPTVAGDTIITSSSKDTVDKVVTATAGYSTAAIKVAYTKISGTVSLKAYIYSGDGTDYVLTDSSAAFDDATGFLYFTKTSVPYSHYKVQVRGAIGANTTQSVKIVVSQLLKRYDD